MSTLICSFDGLHDNRVLRYYADFEAHILHMDTQTEAGEKVSVHFTGLRDFTYDILWNDLPKEVQEQLMDEEESL